MKKLSEKLWPIVLEYTRQVAEVMGCSEWHWIGTNDRGDGVCDVLDLGGSYTLGWSEVLLIVDRLDEWVKRYGSMEAVGDAVKEWEDWWMDEFSENETYICAFDNLLCDRNKWHLRTYPRINLEHWLMGCPRDVVRHELGMFDKVTGMNIEVEILRRLAEEYRGVRTIENVISNIEAKIKFLEEGE